MLNKHTFIKQKPLASPSTWYGVYENSLNNTILQTQMQKYFFYNLKMAFLKQCSVILHIHIQIHRAI